MLNGLFALNPDAYQVVYHPLLDEFRARVQLPTSPLTAANVRDYPEILAATDILLTGWGAPVLDADLLQQMPRLQAVFYAAGSIHYLVTDDFWAKNIPITTSAYPNAIPVAEFTLGHILLGLKRALYYGGETRRIQNFPKTYEALGHTVAVLSLGLIGRRVCELLQPFGLRVLAYDPFLSDAAIRDLGAEPCGLDEAFQQADVVSLHTPLLPATRGLITGAHFQSMRPGATFINTARGAVIRELELIAVLQARPDLFAVLDVTDPEPPVSDSPLYRLDNVMLTPHIAGAKTPREYRALGQMMLDELDRFLRGESLHWQVQQADLARRA